ncbi:hypothetical protein ACVWWR_006573 [Bradyrhizobium sp. LM3.2]
MTTTAQQNHLVALFKAATVIPVLTIERIQDAVPLARALVAGGVRTLEVTMRTPVAIEAARAMMAEVPEAVVGHRHDSQSGRLRPCREARRRVRHQPGPDPGSP